MDTLEQIMIHAPGYGHGWECPKWWQKGLAERGLTPQQICGILINNGEIKASIATTADLMPRGKKERPQCRIYTNYNGLQKQIRQTFRRRRWNLTLWRCVLFVPSVNTDGADCQLGSAVLDDATGRRWVKYIKQAVVPRRRSTAFC